MANSKSIRLMAEDPKDLEIISAAAQDAVTQIGNLRYRAKARRFQVELNRYRWESDRRPRERVRAILGIDGVTAARVRGIPQADPELVISLLQITFTPSETAPSGVVTLIFSGDGEIALDVEALDVTLLDSDTVWPTRHAPDHERRRG